MKGRKFLVSVPWPVRLFGDVSDHLRLPSVTVAVDLRTAVGVRPRPDGKCSVAAPGLIPAGTFDPADTDALKSIPSLAATLDALRGEGISLSGGYDFVIRTRVPGPERLAAGPVLIAAWTAALLALNDRLGELSGNEIALRACEAMRGRPAHEVGISEAYTCVLGGTLYIRHGEKPDVIPIGRRLPGMITGYAETGGRGRERVRDAVERSTAAFRKMRAVMAEFRVGETVIEDVVPRLSALDDSDAGVVYAVLVNRDTCARARELLEGDEGFDDDRLGEMLDRAHEMLRDYLGFRVPRVERLIGAAKEAGALGCRIAADGDAFVAFAPGREQDVIAAVREAGGDARVAAVSDGIRVEECGIVSSE